jgi:hypothetical protein
VLSVWKEQTELLRTAATTSAAEDAELVQRQELVSCSLWLVLAKLEDLSATAAEAEFLDAGVERSTLPSVSDTNTQAMFAQFLLTEVATHPSVQHGCAALFPSLKWLQSPKSSGWELVANFVVRCILCC